jgi:hypothetical protein
MTRPAEGVAAERMAEVGVGTPAVTSGAAFVKNMSASGLWKVSKVDSPEPECDYRLPPFRSLLPPPQDTKALALLSLSSIPEFKATVSYTTNERGRRWKTH